MWAGVEFSFEAIWSWHIDMSLLLEGAGEGFVLLLAQDLFANDLG